MLSFSKAGLESKFMQCFLSLLSQDSRALPSAIKVFYMSSSFWLFCIESHYFSQAEKERTVCKAEQIHKMTTIFTHFE